jgi:8-oxo-dGTP diphosphatase
MVQAVCGILRRNDRFLIGKRKSDNEILGGYWELPGGKIEPSDTSDYTALIREFQEELNIQIKPIHKIKSIEKNGIHMNCWIVDYYSGKAQLMEHDEVKFIKFSEIKNYLFTPLSQSLIHITRDSYQLMFKPHLE